MKKFSVILLIAVLAMTSVFADVDVTLAGSATAKYAVDLDAKTFGYTAPGTGDIVTTFKFSSPSAKVEAAEGLSAELATTLTWTAGSKNSATALGVDQGGYFATAEAAERTLGSKGVGTFKLALSTFNVKYKDVWTLNLLKATTITGFAASTLDYAKGYDINGYVAKVAYADAVAPTTAAGTTLTWNGFTFAAVLNGGLNGYDNKVIYTGVQTPAFTMGKFALTGAGWFNYVGDENQALKDGTATVDSWTIGGSAKLAYTGEKMEITASTDQAIMFGKLRNEKNADPIATKDGKDARYDVDAQLTAKFGPKADFATVEAYYAKFASVKSSTTVFKVTANSFKNLFSAKASFDFAAFGVPMTASFTGLNMLNEAAILSSEFKYTLAEKYVIKAFALDLLTNTKKLDGIKDSAKLTDAEKKAQLNYWNDNGEAQKFGLATELTFGPVVVDANVYARVGQKDNEKVGFGMGAEYTNTYFVATAHIDAEFTAKKSADQFALLTAKAGIESDNIIKNATLSIDYASKNLLDADPYVKGWGTTWSAAESVHAVGKVTTALTVEF